MLTFFSYLWKIAINIIGLLLVIYVFSKVADDKNLTVLLAVLGLMYVTIRTIAWGQWTAWIPMFASMLRSLDALREAAGLPVEGSADEHNQLQKKFSQIQGKLLVDLLFLAVISLICLFQLFTVL